MSNKLPIQITAMMASHEHRLHHYLWHQVRTSWWNYSDNERDEIRLLGWEPPRPIYVRGTNPGQINVLNNSGEDFLYMHRVMIGVVNQKLKEIGDVNYPRIEGWKVIPAPDDIDYPVPLSWDSPNQRLNQSLKEVKSDSFYSNRIKLSEEQFKNHEYLKTISLGELGTRVEFTIHNWLHMRFCSKVDELRPVPSKFSTSIDSKWDNPNYDWLGDTYSSHVNSTFWKLHGWVDDRIEDWKLANGIDDEINWIGQWTGDMPGQTENHSMHSSLKNDLKKEKMLANDHDHNHHMKMMAVLKVINKSGVCSEFYDNLNPEFNK